MSPPVVKAPAWIGDDPGSIPSFAVGIFFRVESYHAVTSKLVLQVLPCVKGSALGLVGTVSVYCDCVI